MAYMAKIAVGDAAQNGNMVRQAVSAQPAVKNGLSRTLTSAELEKAALAIMAERRNRYSLFGQHLFADPAWDILLVLTIAECRQRRMTVTQLCQRVDVPMTTALRWITNMTNEELLVRRDDMTDKRRKFIELSPDALEKMVQYCSTAATPRLLAA